MSRYFGGVLKNSLVNNEFKTRKMVMWNSFTDKIIVTSQTR